MTAGYLAITLAYSLQLKRYVLMDVIVLAGLYTVRVIAGIVAIRVAPSFWLLSFSMFIFLSLALVKRCAEINTLLKAKRSGASGRDYRVSDLDYLHSMGTASGYLCRYGTGPVYQQSGDEGAILPSLLPLAPLSDSALLDKPRLAQDREG